MSISGQSQGAEQSSGAQVEGAGRTGLDGCSDSETGRGEGGLGPSAEGGAAIGRTAQHPAVVLDGLRIAIRRHQPAARRREQCRARTDDTGFSEQGVGERERLRKGPSKERGLGSEQALSRARRDIQESQEGAWRDDPKRRGAFQLHYYGLDEDPDLFPEALDTIRAQIENLLQSRIYRQMARFPARILQVEELLSIDVEGVPVWVKLDGLMRGKDGGVVVVDWKTGKSHSNTSVDRQLGVYGLYALQKWVDRPDRIKAMHVNLREDEFRVFTMDQEQLDDTAAFILESASGMRALLQPEGDNEALEEDFPRLDEGDPRCGRCRFRRDCNRE